MAEIATVAAPRYFLEGIMCQLGTGTPTEPMAARDHVNGRGPTRCVGRDERSEGSVGYQSPATKPHRCHGHKLSGHSVLTGGGMSEAKVLQGKMSPVI